MFFFFLDKYVLSMATLRFLSSLVEMTAACLMLKFNRVDTALKINAALALVGPTVMMMVTAVGLWGLAGKVTAEKFLMILAGVALIFYGLHR
ncbi:MAG: YqhV family protein [Thermanaeromonas sp.]|uniref:YqhV family protein n=1 Tax=Thermanaeromonas sp. TaxID=2003697 RepID=UPI00243B3F3A|nr:YqhV family protein [Thermanaeromonas sp.]MCG0277668.1 YqhV family protein [Thermanaeromonas sp.]